MLMTSLAILLGLMLIGLGVGAMLQNDFRTSGNLRGSTEALYYSSAGNAWGKEQISRVESFPPVVANRQMAFSSGVFTVASQSSSVVGPLSARAVLRSTGTSGSARQLVEAQVTKTYDLADAALVLRGNAAAVNLGAADIYISGADHDESGARIVEASSRQAVSTGDAALTSLFSQVIAGHPEVLDHSTGTRSLSTSAYLPGTFVTRLADDLCGSSIASRQAVPTTGQLALENQVWGTHTAPQLHCFDGRADMNDVVALAGNSSGSGILVLRHADLLLSGSFRWDGLVVITGNDISFKTTGSDHKLILGAVIVNGTDIPGAERKLLDFEGAIRILYSRPSMMKTAQLLPASVLTPAYAALPSTITQNYWRADNH